MTPVCSDTEHDSDLLFNASSGFLKRACHMWDEGQTGTSSKMGTTLWFPELGARLPYRYCANRHATIGRL